MPTTRKLHVRQDVIGPRHDPYARDRRSVVVDDVWTTLVTCALEMASWVEVNGVVVSGSYRRFGDNRVSVAEGPDRCFERLTGISARRFDEYYDRLHPEPDVMVGYF